MKAFSQILSYFFPSQCLSCESMFEFGEENSFCETCSQEICEMGLNLCRVCGDSFGNSEIPAHVCGKCLQNPPSFEWARSVFDLSLPLSKMLHAFKYSGNETALSWMVIEMKKLLGRHFSGWKADFIVPVPLHPLRLVWRGYNQSLLLARVLSKSMKIPLDFENLVKIKSTRAQSTLSRQDRCKQLKDAFIVRKPALFEGKKILLVDDVYTTGATLLECAKVLKNKGSQVYALTLARTPLLGMGMRGKIS